MFLFLSFYRGFPNSSGQLIRCLNTFAKPRSMNINLEKTWGKKGANGLKRATGKYGKEPRSDTCIDFIAAADHLSSFHQIHLIASQHSFPTCTSTNYPTVPSSLL